MATMSDWQKEAEEQAKKYSDALKQDNQQVLNQLAAAKESSLNSLNEQQNNAIYNLNQSKSTINSSAEQNAKELNVNRLLSLKSNQDAMNRAGLGTQGIVGSQTNNINNSYNNSLSDVLNQKSSNLKELDKEKNNTMLEYNTNRLNLSNEYDNNYSNALSSINDKASNQYNTIYNNYIAYKQQEYDNQKAEEARIEAVRQYNESLNLQRAQLAQNKEQFYASLDANNNFDDSKYYIKTDHYDGNMPSNTYADLQKGAFNTTDRYGNYYQPNNVNGNALSSIGKAGYYLGSKAENSSGVPVADQKLWQSTDGKFYVWNGSKMCYEQQQIPKSSSFMK